MKSECYVYCKKLNTGTRVLMVEVLRLQILRVRILRVRVYGEMM